MKSPVAFLRSLWSRFTCPRPRWRLIGYDTFADEYYELPGTYPTREAAAVAERAQEQENERNQPNAGTLRDKVFILRSDQPLPGPRFR
jgi:hypothetical protein